MQHARLIVFVIAAGMLAFGVFTIFSPATSADILDLLAVNEAGSSALRAMIGAHYLAMGILLLIGTQGRGDAIRAVALIEAAMVFARIVGIANGETVLMVIGLTLAEIILVGYLLFASGRLSR